jgi:hypothetical protein
MTDVDEPTGSQLEPFLLRGLIWCELCAGQMLPVLLSGGRFYGCPYRECPRRLIEAEVVEHAVWRQYALLYEGTDIAVPTAVRWKSLRQRLARVRVGEDATELWHEWTD